MDNQGAGQAAQQNLQPQQQAALIRPDQLRKLPHLNDQQKQQHEALVQRLWDAVNGQPQNSENWQKAFSKLGQVSKSLMAGMRTWQANMRQQQAAAAAASAGATGGVANPQQPSSNVANFSQLNPAIQARVNGSNITYPPTVKQGTPQADEWLKEAKFRFGQALQRLELAKAKLAEFSKMVQQRTQSGNALTPQEMEQVQQKTAQYKKTIQESNSFLERFKTQQAGFRAEMQAQQQSVTAPSQGPQIEGAVDTVGSQNPPTNGQGPAAHTISSAVNAARSQANAAQQASATSPVIQTTPSQAQGSGPLPSGAQPSSGASVAQSPYNNASTQGDVSATTQAANQQQQAMNGPPRPLSQSAAVQAAQNYPSSASQQQQPQSATTTHAHPPYIQATNFLKKDERMKISPNLNTKPHEPVSMPPARPTLTGGPSVGAIGQMGQPGIPKMPGYVLEGAGNERVLSKNKLNELVREITGSGPEDGDQLSPEAEEVVLNLADEFVDQLVTSSCRLAKLRGSSVLDIRDVQVILERQYNIRIPGYSTDEIRTVRRVHPNVEYLQKMGAVQAAKVTGGGSLANGKEN